MLCIVDSIVLLNWPVMYRAWVVSSGCVLLRCAAALFLVQTRPRSPGVSARRPARRQRPCCACDHARGTAQCLRAYRYTANLIGLAR